MGSGFKDFAAGDVLTAADVDGYLMRQTVMTFADASARDTALSGVLDEGMFAYLEDTDSVTVYSGTAWRTFGARVIGYETRTTDYTVYAGLITSAPDMFASPITFTSTATNSYLLELNLIYSMSATTSGYVTFNFADGGNMIDEAASVSSSNGDGTNNWTLCHRYIWTPGSAASRSINARGAVGNGATADANGDLDLLLSDGTYYPWMAVYDLGVLP